MLFLLTEQAPEDWVEKKNPSIVCHFSWKILVIQIDHWPNPMRMSREIGTLNRKFNVNRCGFRPGNNFWKSPISWPNVLKQLKLRMPCGWATNWKKSDQTDQQSDDKKIEGRNFFVNWPNSCGPRAKVPIESTCRGNNRPDIAKRWAGATTQCVVLHVWGEKADISWTHSRQTSFRRQVLTFPGRDQPNSKRSRQSEAGREVRSTWQGKWTNKSRAPSCSRRPAAFAVVLSTTRNWSNQTWFVILKKTLTG